MSELNEMFEQNLKFQRLIVKNFESLTEKERELLTKDYVLHAVDELTELLESINWKTWSEESKKVSLPQLKEELTDALKFIINIALLWNITSTQLYDDFTRKSEVNLQRFAQKELLKHSHDKICAIDIDGVIYPYSESFVEFAQVKTHKAVKASDELSPVITGVSSEEYLSLKNIYREEYGEIWNSSKPIQHSVKLLAELKNRGYHIILLSARPYKKYPNIYTNTLRWLRLHQVPFDFIYWSDNKVEKILSEFPQLKFIVEDSPAEVEKIDSFGIKCYLLSQPYNKHYTGKSKRISNLLEVLDCES